MPAVVSHFKFSPHFQPSGRHGARYPKGRIGLVPGQGGRIARKKRSTYDEIFNKSNENSSVRTSNGTDPI